MIPGPRSPRLRNAFCAAVTLAAACPACGSDPTEGGGDPGAFAPGQRVPFPTATWTFASPEDMGMSSSKLEEARAYAMRPDHETQSVVVVRGGAIVGEWFAEGADADSWATSWSMAKSFTSALVGIAIDEGWIDGVDEPLSAFYPEWSGTPKGEIRLRSLLHMQSGIAYYEDYADLERSDTIKMGLSPDALGYVESLPLEVAPDSRWAYASSDTLLLGGVLERVTGRSASDLARERLFEPLGMHRAEWWVDGAGHSLSFCCIDAPTRELAKFGLLFLRNGQWGSSSIVSPEWVERSTLGDRAPLNPGYAYQWWNRDIDPNSPLPSDVYSARGEDEQVIYVVPSLDLVVVRSGRFAKPPGDAVAEDGFIREMLIRGLGPYGTKSPTLWEEVPFLGRIINAIDGVQPIPIDETAVSTGGTRAECRAAALTYPGFCEAVHGCACDACASELVACDGNAQCKAIVQCALETGCRGFSCFEPCRAVIEANGGAEGTGVALALPLSDCVTAPCALTCP